MLLSILLMLEFLLKMHFGHFLRLPTPLVMPHPTYICSLVLTASVSIGYCYIFVRLKICKLFKNKFLIIKIYKLALYPCDRAVEAQDWPHMLLDSILRLTISLYSLISFIYVMQRRPISLSINFIVFKHFQNPHWLN
jgi:hypothetical protein